MLGNAIETKLPLTETAFFQQTRVRIHRFAVQDIKKDLPPKEMDLQKKSTKKNTPAILNMSLAGKSTVKVDVFCFLKKSEIHCYTRAFDTSITILVMGEMNGLSFRKENYHPATVHFHNFSEKGNVVQS